MTNPSSAENAVTVATFPTEVEILAPVTIAGTYDTIQVAQVIVVAEDKYPLPTDSDRGQWQVQMPNGFNMPGTRWLRVKGLDPAGKAIATMTISINVTPPAIVLTVKQDTVFKLSPADSSTLPANAKVAVKAGQTFRLLRYGILDGHLKAYLRDPISPIGDFGYFFLPHVSVKAPITLAAKQNTFFKATTDPADRLAANQKAAVKSGFLSDLQECAIVGNHVKVTLMQDIPPLGKTGYFFTGHVQLSKLGIEFPPFVPTDIPTNKTTLTVRTDTFWKAKPVNSTDLANTQKVLLKAGSSYDAEGYAAIDGHFKIKLKTAIAPVGMTGYCFWQHVQLIKNGQVLPFDPDMKTVTLNQDSTFKRQPVDSAQLSANDKAPVAKGQVYGVAGYGITGNHFQVNLTETVSPVGTAGYLFAPHVTLKQGNKTIAVQSDRKVLGVTYFSQRDNPRDPYVTCNVTSIAMVLYYHGVRSRSGGQLEDELYQWIIDRYGAAARTDNSVLQELYRAYGFSGGFATNRSWQLIKAEITANRPVVIGGYFTHGGHIVCIIGYDPDGFIVHDPYGDALTGYAVTEGKSMSYSYSYMRQMCGEDGDVWAHFIVPKA